MNKVYITAYSTISAVGVGSEESLKNLKNAKQLLKFPEKNDKFHRPYFQIDNFTSDNKNTIRASDMVLKLFSLTEDKWKNFDSLEIFSSTSTGGIKETEEVFEDLYNKKTDYPLFERHFFNKVINDLNEKYNGKFVDSFTFSTACSSSGHSLMQAFELIKNGIIDKACVIGYDVLSLTTMVGFDSLKLVSLTGTKPLTLERDGLTLGEGGAIIFLESNPEKEPVAEIVGASSNVDAYHISSPDPEGTQQEICMMNAVKMAGIGVKEIDYINAHGTGTMINDEVEMKIIKRAFPKACPVSSLKSFVGHTLGASAILEATLCLDMLKMGVIFQPENLGTPMDPGYILTKSIEKEVKYFLKNSFGFGGNNVSLVFRML